MFPVDSLHPSYYEDRSAEKSKKPSTQQAQRPSTSSGSCSSQTSPPLLQRPPLSRPGSSTVLGTIFNGFARANSPARSEKSGSSSGTSTPVLMPVLNPSKAVSAAQFEALLAAERKKDADIQAFRAW